MLSDVNGAGFDGAPISGDLLVDYFKATLNKVEVWLDEERIALKNLTGGHVSITNHYTSRKCYCQLFFFSS